MQAVPQVVEYFIKMLPDWYMVVTDAHGLSGGLAAIWDPWWVNVKAFSCFAGILLTGHILKLKGRIHIINVYAPYRDRAIFWDSLIESELPDLTSLIIVGDLNCTICLNEIWGCSRKVDVMVDYIKDIILKHNLVDICPSMFIPT